MGGDRDAQPTIAQDAISDHIRHAFSALGNETRLQVLLTLWEVYDPWAESNAMTFSELRERIGFRDSGQFSYHLDKLVGEFVRKDEAGYTLTISGFEVVRAVVQAASQDMPSPEPVETDEPCPLCGAPTEVRYENARLSLCCTACPGRFGAEDEFSDGALATLVCNRIALVGRTLPEVFEAAFMTIVLDDTRLWFQMVCPGCRGPVTRSLDICPDHDVEGVCGQCGRRNEVALDLTCIVCKSWIRSAPARSLSANPAVQKLALDAGIPLTHDEHRSFLPESVVPTPEFEQEVLSVEPPRIRMTLTQEDSRLSFVVGDGLALSEISTE